MTSIKLKTYDKSWYYPGRSAVWQAAWFFVGLPIMRAAWLPSSSMRVLLLRLFGGRVGHGVVIKPGVHVKYPWHLIVGDHCWLGESCWIDNLTTVQLGSNVCISQGAYLCTGNHDWTDPAFGLMIAPIRLEDGSWAGAKSILMPGVVLGRGAVAGAGSVVNHLVPAYEIHVGNPAVFVKKRSVREPSVGTPGVHTAPQEVQ